MQFFYKYRLFFLLIFLLNCITVYFLLTIQKGDEINWFLAHRTIFLNYFFSYASAFVETKFLILFLVVYLAINRKLFFYTGINLLFILLVVQFLKHQVFADSLRPSALMAAIQGVEGAPLLKQFSFPSGHTATAFSLFIMPIFFYTKKYSTLLLVALAVAVGISRMYLSQHFLEDVLAGANIGCIITILVYICLLNWKQFDFFIDKIDAKISKYN